MFWANDRKWVRRICFSVTELGRKGHINTSLLDFGHLIRREAVKLGKGTFGKALVTS